MNRPGRRGHRRERGRTWQGREDAEGREDTWGGQDMMAGVDTGGEDSEQRLCPPLPPHDIPPRPLCGSEDGREILQEEFLMLEEGSKPWRSVGSPKTRGGSPKRRDGSPESRGRNLDE